MACHQFEALTAYYLKKECPEYMGEFRLTSEYVNILVEEEFNA
jgi:hypothetical protein